MRLFWSVTALCTVLGVVSARLADTLLDKRIAIIGDFAGLQYGLNPGIAWGIRLPSGLQEALILIALACVGFLAYRSCKPESGITNDVLRMRQTAFGLILGGGLGNIIDRIPDGVVTDFIQIGSFPVFNLPDSFVTVGVGLLFLDSLRRDKG